MQVKTPHVIVPVFYRHNLTDLTPSSKSSSNGLICPVLQNALAGLIDLTMERRAITLHIK